MKLRHTHKKTKIDNQISSYSPPLPLENRKDEALLRNQTFKENSEKKNI